MLPAVTRTATAALTALALAAATVSPAQALGKNERNVLKGIAAAVIINEFVKQSRAHARPAPAPQPVQPSYGHHNQNRYQPQYRPQPQQHQQVNAAARAFQEYSPQARRMIQSRLAAYGYYRGAIDGIWGRGTEGAVAAYARDVNASASLRTRDGSVQLYNALIS